jgi:regulator of replication initiation timing
MIKAIICKEVLHENTKLKNENTVLRQKLAEKQQHINKVNEFWKKKLYSKNSKKREAVH